MMEIFQTLNTMATVWGKESSTINILILNKMTKIEGIKAHRPGFNVLLNATLIKPPSCPSTLLIRYHKQLTCYTITASLGSGIWDKSIEAFSSTVGSRVSALAKETIKGRNWKNKAPRTQPSLGKRRAFPNFCKIIHEACTSHHK